MQAIRRKHVRTFLTGYRSGGTPCVFNKPRRALELWAVDEGAVPASAPATSRLFVLPVAARWWVSTDNTLSIPSFAQSGRPLGHTIVNDRRDQTLHVLISFVARLTLS